MFDKLLSVQDLAMFSYAYGLSFVFAIAPLLFVWLWDRIGCQGSSLITSDERLSLSV